jgi:4a-hydroxytetrahydrobiopterin dehydratase
MSAAEVDENEACAIGAGLRGKKCVPCEGGVPKLTHDEIGALMGQVSSTWSVVDDHHLVRTLKFPDFARALAFTNAVGAIAEAEWHHPDIHVGWGKVEITLFTHAIDGLAENDFIVAAKIDALPVE